jgi:5-formyltetrahydrofolate cyclo-ligase
LEHLKGNFLKSDLDLVLCPGVAFDTRGARLGRGKHYYDNFLSELKGKIPIVGLAFSCQISNTPLPCDPYSDIRMDEVITEDGPIMGTGSGESLPAG